MDTSIKKIMENYEISEEQYNKIYKYIEDMDIAYHENKDLSKYNYENFVSRLIGDKCVHYPAEDILIALYKIGKFQELIRNVIYKNDTKVLSKLNNKYQ